MSVAVYDIKEKVREKEYWRKVDEIPMVKACGLIATASKDELRQMVFEFATNYFRMLCHDDEHEQYLRGCEHDEEEVSKEWILEEWAGLEEMYRELGYQLVVDSFKRRNNRECSSSDIDEG